MTRRAVISGLLPLLREGDSYLILCHKSPDGDAVGSAEALRLLLAGLGKQAVCACADPLPEYLRFIPEIPFLCCPTPNCLPEYKILLTVDTADPSLLGGLAPLGESAFIKIDHHRSGKSYGKHEYTDPAAAATGEILFSLAKEADLLTPAVADALYTAIASDTGCLRYSNTTADTLSAAASLLRAGARQELINRRLFENKPLSRVKATAEGISRMELLLDGQAALLLVTKEMMKQGGYTAEDFGEISSAMREIRGVEFSARLLQDEAEEEEFHLSCRSKEWFDCTGLCARFGGGGHLHAAGATLRAASPALAMNALREATLSLFSPEKTFSYEQTGKEDGR